MWQETVSEISLRYCIIIYVQILDNSIYVVCYSEYAASEPTIETKFLLLTRCAEQRTAIVELYIFVAIISNGAIHTLDVDIVYSDN